MAGSLNNLLHSVTGTASKAVLLISRENKKPALAGPTHMPNVKSGLTALANNVAATAASGLDAAKNALSGMTAGILGAGGDYFTLQVQYNPNTISMNSVKGEYISKNGCGQLIDQISLKPQTTLDVTLIFDDMNIADAFDMENNISIASAKDVGAHLLGDGESIRDTVELLTGIISNDSSKHVMFVWADMSFGGVLANVDTRYTMFNRKGEPIRAEVTLHIIQNNKEQAINEGDMTLQAAGSSFISYWKRSFDDLFKENKDGGGIVNDAQSKMKKAGNLINF